MEITHLLVSILVIFIVGCLTHFTYNWSKRNKFVAIFSAVNESTWEHIKIGLTGFFIWTLFDYPIYGSNPNYWPAKAVSFLIFIILIPLDHYLVSHSLKKVPIVLDIIEFIFAVAMSQILFSGVLSAPKLSNWLLFPAFVVIFITLVAYFTFTFIPPKIPTLFKDPETGLYGLACHHLPRKKKGRNRSKK